MTMRHECARRLLSKASEDRYVLAGLVADNAAPIGPLGFHAQQAVEKSLKAVLAARGIEHPHTHNIAALLAMLVQNQIERPPDFAELPQLTPFGVAIRYDDIGEADDASLDRVGALACVDRTIAWAEGQISD